MPSAAQAVRIYQELADWHAQQGQPQQRDRFLVLAADAALAAGQSEDAERLRTRLLQHNPHHLLKPYGSFAEAMRAGDVQSYLTALRQSNPPEAAERLLASLQEQPAAAEAEPPIFRVRREVELPPQPPRPRQAPPPHTRQTPQAVPLAQPVAPLPKARPTPFPAPRPDVFATESEANPLPVRRPRALEAEESTTGGGMLAAALFALVLMASLVLAVWTFVRPFFAV